MVPATVNLAVLVEIDQIDKQFIADAADEARRVPANTVPSSRGKDGDVPSIDLPTALLTDGSCHGHRERPDISSP